MTNVESILRRVAHLKKIPPEKIGDRTSTDPNVLRARQLAAETLSVYWNDRDDGRVAQRLDSSIDLVRQAHKLAQSDLVFQAELKKVGVIPAKPAPSEVPGAPVEEPRPVVEKPEHVDHIALLESISIKHFGLNRHDLKAKRTSPKIAHARRVLTRLAVEGFLLQKEDVADFFGCAIETILRVIQEANADYLSRGHFYREVSAIAKEHGILAERHLRVRA